MDARVFASAIGRGGQRPQKKRLKTQLAALRTLAGPGSTRAIEEIRGSDRERKKRERKAASVVHIPPCANRDAGSDWKLTMRRGFAGIAMIHAGR